MGPWILAALLQIPAPQAPIVEPNEAARPRFSLGAQFTGIAVNISEGRHTGLGVGVNASIPVARRTAIDLRVSHMLPFGDFGMYDVRWRRMLKPPHNGLPHYFAAGIAGVYYKEVSFPNNVRRERYGISYPQVLSLATGWTNSVGRHAGVPFEIGAFAHPYGLLAATATLGFTWSPRGRATMAR